MTNEQLLLALAAPAAGLAWWLALRGRDAGTLMAAVASIGKTTERIEAAQIIESAKTLQLQLDVAAMKGERRAEDKRPAGHTAE